MKHSLGPLALGALALLLPRVATAENRARAVQGAPKVEVGSSSVPLRVVDVADDRAYIEPGADKGLRVGDEVEFGEAKFKVVTVSSSQAALALAGKPLPFGARGVADVRANRPERIVLGLAKPTPLARFRGALQPLARPAAAQQPKRVPLGTKSRSQNSWVVSDALYAVIPVDGKERFVGNELRSRVRYESYAEMPLFFAADVAVQSFAGDGFASRPGAAARQVLRVRELSLGYGSSASFRGLLGRLRGASMFVGQLDGARLEAPLGLELRLSAFGGLAPHTFNGMVSDQVARFGGNLVYQDTRSALQPRIVLGGHASRFAGALDERRIYAAFDLLPRRGRIGGHSEVSFFDANNPWHASTTELTSAGLDANFEVDIFHIGGRAELRRPDRSRWLASLLPDEWFCWGNPAEARRSCLANEANYLWLLDAGARIGKFSVDVAGQSSFTRGTDATNFGGFANLRWLDVVGRVHVDAGMSAFSGSVVRSTAVTLAPGVVFARGAADLSLRYRPSIVRYRADLRSGLEQALGAALWVSPSEALDIDMEGDWIHGREVDAVVVQGVVAWRFAL